MSDTVACKSSVEALQLPLADADANHLRPTAVRRLAICGVVGRVVDGLETDPVAGGEIASGDALRPLFGDAQALGFGQSAAA